jgi:hypothetical protein
MAIRWGSWMRMVVTTGEKRITSGRELDRVLRLE